MTHASRASTVSSAKAIQHFHHLDSRARESLFHLPPQEIGEDADRRLLATALGATLYIPADRPDLAATVSRRASAGVCSMVLDLEDAVDEDNAVDAINNVISALETLAGDHSATRTMLFVRVRNSSCFDDIFGKLTAATAAALTGFVVPKFAASSGETYLQRIVDATHTFGRHLYCMPVVESERVLYRETRDEELAQIARLLGVYRDWILAVRIGATDMSGTFGIRRDRDHTIYDVKVVADAIADTVNRLGRNDGTGFVVTAPVWEYFADHERLFRPMLRSTPFEDHDAVRFRDMLVSRDLDALLREISLDRVNGLLGKTVIHPIHVAAVHALSVVSHEEYRDAADVVAAEAGGVRRSAYRNKMNEPRPHRHWAEGVLRRAQVFGVANQGVTFVDFLTCLADT